MTGADAPLSILHVDDDPDLSALVKLYLEDQTDDVECTVATETAPADALDRIQSGESFDVVVTDYDMPRMNGIEFLEALREAHPEQPVLLFSGEETAEIAAEIVRVGVTDYLRKGVGTDQYTRLVRRVERAADSDGQFDPEAETELDGVGVVGADDRFDTADETYASFYRYDSDDIVGKHWTDLHPESEVEHIRQNVLPVVRSGGKWSGRSEGLRADGTTFPESKMVTALDDGRLLIAVSAVEEAADADGTERPRPTDGNDTR